MPPRARPNLRPRGTATFTKPPLNWDELVDRWISRGLVVPDRERAKRYVRHIGYFRFSPYLLPFRLDPAQEQLQVGTEFDAVLNLYVFDRSLRLLVLDAVDRIEVAIRAALTDHMSLAYSDAHWYVDRAHFARAKQHDGLLKIVRDAIDERLAGKPEPSGSQLLHRSALEHYLLTYGAPELPPSWLMVESLTIGQLRSMLENLKQRSDQAEVAKGLGLQRPVLLSWLRAYVRVRNICAHHGRLWNVGLGVYPQIPTSDKISWPRGEGLVSDRSRSRLYPVLASLQSILDTISPSSTWTQRLYELFRGKPPMYLAGMGVPANWFNDPFWARHIAVH